MIAVNSNALACYPSLCGLLIRLTSDDAKAVAQITMAPTAAAVST